MAQTTEGKQFNRATRKQTSQEKTQRKRFSFLIMQGQKSIPHNDVFKLLGLHFSMASVFDCVLMTCGSTTWFAAILIENVIMKGNYVNGQMNSPCVSQSAFSGYNYLFVALPVALILVAEIRIMNTLGSIGLLCIFEAACVLTITGYTQFTGQYHVLACVLTGITNALMCMNCGFEQGLAIIVPGTVLSILFLTNYCVYHPDMTKDRPYTCISIINWFFDLLIIFGRNGLLFRTTKSDWVDRFYFDVYGFMALCGFAAMCLGVMKLREKRETHV